MTRRQKVPVFSVFFDPGGLLPGYRLRAHASSVYGLSTLSRLADITANTVSHLLAPGNLASGNEAFTAGATSPITKVSSTFRTLKLPGGTGHSCGSTDFPVRV